MERLKISGFAVQYGIMDEDTFLPLAAEEDDYEDMMAGITNRTTRIFTNQYYLRHYHIYDDPIEGSTESIPVNVRAVRQ
jgi:hypothetical protein